MKSLPEQLLALGQALIPNHVLKRVPAGGVGNHSLAPEGAHSHGHSTDEMCNLARSGRAERLSGNLSVILSVVP